MRGICDTHPARVKEHTPFFMSKPMSLVVLRRGIDINYVILVLFCFVFFTPLSCTISTTSSYSVSTWEHANVILSPLAKLERLSESRVQGGEMPYKSKLYVDVSKMYHFYCTASLSQVERICETFCHQNCCQRKILIYSFAIWLPRRIISS